MNKPKRATSNRARNEKETTNMRFSLLVFYGHIGGVHVRNTLDEVRANKMLLSDRIANGEAFPREHVIRLPRRLTKTRKPIRAALADLLNTKQHWI